MTKDEALLLAVANARGLVTLTAREAAEMDVHVAHYADELRRSLASARVVSAQQRIASVAPDAYSLLDNVRELKLAMDHQREVADLAMADRDLRSRAQASTKILADARHTTDVS